MKALFVDDVRSVPAIQSWLTARRTLGLDRWDEVWNGVYQVSPGPGDAHGELLMLFGAVLLKQAHRYRLGRVIGGPNVRQPGSGRRNYRVPDIALVRPRKRSVKGWLESGVALAVEIRSPREVVTKKLPFYAARRIDEVFHVEPETLELGLFRLSGDSYEPVAPAADGSVEIVTVALRVRRTSRRAKVELAFRDLRSGQTVSPF